MSEIFDNELHEYLTEIDGDIQEDEPFEDRADRLYDEWRDQRGEEYLDLHKAKM